MATRDEERKKYYGYGGGSLIPTFGAPGSQKFDKVTPKREGNMVTGEDLKNTAKAAKQFGQDWWSAVTSPTTWLGRTHKAWEKEGLGAVPGQLVKEIAYGGAIVADALSPGPSYRYGAKDITERAAKEIVDPGIVDRPSNLPLKPAPSPGRSPGLFSTGAAAYGFGGGGKDQRPSAPAEGTASQQAQAQAAAAAQGQDKTPDMPWQTETTAEGGFRAYRPGESIGYFQAGSPLKPGVPVKSAFGTFTPMEGGGTFSQLQGLTADEYNAKANAVRAQREAIRSLRPARGGGGGGDLSPSPYEREQLLQNYKKELNSIMRDSDKYRITARGASNKIGALNDWFSAAMGLSPQQKEAGENRRAELAAATDIEQANIVGQYGLAKEALSPTKRFKTEWDENLGAFVQSDEVTGQTKLINSFEMALNMAPAELQNAYRMATDPNEKAKLKEQIIAQLGG